MARQDGVDGADGAVCSLEPGRSPFAVPAAQLFDEKRPLRPEVFGLVVHTTGSGATNRAWKQRRSVLDWCIERYLTTFGCHYICGYKGLDAELVQVGNEYRRPNTVGMAEQNRSIDRGRFARDLKPRMLFHWRNRWPGKASPRNLFPGRSVNQFYAGVEMPPCVWWNTSRGRNHVSAPPMRQGLRYTRAQHDAIVQLAWDMANRHAWSGNWWETGRLVGHEDLSPLTRQNSGGGWDPGALRGEPWWDWAYIRSELRAKVHGPGAGGGFDGNTV